MGLVAWMMALTMPSTTVWVGVKRTLARPTEFRPVRNSVMESAPAIQPANEPRSARCSGVSSILGHDVRDADAATRS